MSWQGGGGGWSGGSGGQSQQSRMAYFLGAEPGQPFPGVPAEELAKIQKVLASEPEIGEIETSFSQVNSETRPFSLGRFLAPHWILILLALVLVAVETVTMQAGPKLTQIGIDRGILEGNFGVVVLAALLYMGAIVLNGLVGYARAAWTGRLGERLLYTLRLRVFSHLQRLSVDFFTEEKAGRIMTRMTSDIEALSVLFHEGLINLVMQALTLVVVVAVLFSLNVPLALAVTLGIVPVLTIMTIWFRSASHRGYLAVRDRIAEVLSDLQESLSGVRVVSAHNRQNHNIIKHRNIVGDHFEANRQMALVGAIYAPGTEVVGMLARVVVLVVGGPMVLRGDLSVGGLTAFVLYLSAFFAPVQQLVQLYNTYQQGRAAVIKLRELLATPSSVPEKPGAYDLPPLRGEIVFEDVSFGYSPERPVLSNIDLVIEAGETFALVGETGAGKSTIAKLIARFYDSLQGRILIDGHDLREVTLASLRSQLGVVPQEPFLFADTIRANVAFSKPDAEEEEIVEACRAAGLEELIRRLPQGLDTACHERGITLSSGERQLLALARAFLSHPRVLLLDEATSNLDLATEAKIERAMDLLLEGRTAILIAHRLTTAMRADRIAVVHAGRIVELGSHEELVALGGHYAEMYATWSSHAIQESLTPN